MITLKQVQDEVEQFRRHVAARDFEAATGVERDLFVDVLNHIAEGHRGGQKLAQEALKVQDVEGRDRLI